LFSKRECCILVGEKNEMKNFSFLCFLLFLQAVNSTPASNDELEIALKERKIKELKATGANLVFFINIYNSSRSPYYLTGYNYRFVVEQKEYARVEETLEEKIEIEGSKTTLLSLPLKIIYETLFNTFPGMEKREKASCYLAGNLFFSSEKGERKKLPFAFSGEFPIFKQPEIELLALCLNDLTIGGADLFLKVKFKNLNGFELLIERIEYKFSLGGYLLGEGQIEGDKSISSQGEKIFFLPFLINFFEVGKEVYELLKRPASSCVFEGTMEISTIWQLLEIAFKKEGEVKIQPSEDD